MVTHGLLQLTQALAVDDGALSSMMAREALTTQIDVEAVVVARVVGLLFVLFNIHTGLGVRFIHFFFNRILLSHRLVLLHYLIFILFLFGLDLLGQRGFTVPFTRERLRYHLLDDLALCIDPFRFDLLTLVLKSCKVFQVALKVGATLRSLIGYSLFLTSTSSFYSFRFAFFRFLEQVSLDLLLVAADLIEAL